MVDSQTLVNLRKTGKFYLIKNQYGYDLYNYGEIVKTFKDEETANMVLQTLNKVKKLIESKSAR